MGKIIVIGDLMWDKSVYYKTGERENPEDPLIPLVRQDTLKEEYRLGGAGNLAANIQAMVGNVLLYGPYNGHMTLSRSIIEKCKDQDIEFQRIRTPAGVIVKERLYVNGRNMLRIDKEETISIASEEKERIAHMLLHGKPSYIVISDYLKGTIDEELVTLLKEGAKEAGSKLLVDTKPKHIDLFGGVYLIKPNLKEFRAMIEQPSLSNNDEEVACAGMHFVQKYKTNLVVTRSEKGATLITKEGEVFHFPTHVDSHDLVDVTGAGDTFLAGVTAGLVKGLPLQMAVELGNKASGIAVRQKGTSVVTADQLEI